MTTNCKFDKACYFDKRWRDDGWEIAVLETGIKLFHAGLARDVDDFDQARPTWFATGSGAREYALSYAKTGYVGKQTFLLVCRVCRPLKCARFASADFTHYIHEHHASWPPRMLPALYEWGMSQAGLDGIYFDCKHPEVALFQSSTTPLLQVRCERAAQDE